MFQGLDIDGATVSAMLVLYVVLGAASAAVTWLGRASPTGSLRLQVNAWWFIFPVFSVAWALYPWGPGLLVALIAALAWRELALHHPTAPRRFQWACAALLALQFAVMGAELPGAVALLPVLALLQLIRWWQQPAPARLLWLLFLLLCAGLGFVLQLERLPLDMAQRRAWFFYLFTVTALNDVAQFISGKCLGRHKIAKTISPNKTWAGLLGGVVASALVSLALGMQLQLASAPFLLALGAGLSLAGFLGDLVFSAAKRALGLKDFSNLIPGHGGILDRADSLVLTAPLLYGVLRWSLH
ncbi:phosphatidate cytidylyltransferase [Rhodoferax sp.]|uniref:phosphatidate cytidylyltransferase n=1 Tax=Rhodoferax sp. TaxID=50421 RepID=UPI002ACD6D8E|nr:phosphatidate cytidylyltransferase [Rhodoferax sp.]MDZ7920222.1 phosphatidate cytidylyltransferase [Rhodoferax sp.]